MISTLPAGIEHDISLYQVASSKAVVEVDSSPWDVKYDVVANDTEMFVPWEVVTNVKDGRRKRSMNHHRATHF